MYDLNTFENVNVSGHITENLNISGRSVLDIFHHTEPSNRGIGLGGMLALGAGAFFLWNSFKNKKPQSSSRSDFDMCTEMLNIILKDLENGVPYSDLRKTFEGITKEVYSKSTAWPILERKSIYLIIDRIYRFE